MWLHLLFFFFQAEDGIRAPLVTGVQTCALPILGLHQLMTRTSAPTTGAPVAVVTCPPTVNVGQRSTMSWSPPHAARALKKDVTAIARQRPAILTVPASGRSGTAPSAALCRARAAPARA